MLYICLDLGIILWHIRLVQLNQMFMYDLCVFNMSVAP